MEKQAKYEGKTAGGGKILRWETRKSKLATNHRVSSFEFRISIFGK